MPILTKHLNIKTTIFERTKTFLFLLALLSVTTMVMLSSANAQQTVEHEVIESAELNQAELDQILAPIALYPDSLLSQILVASTYPIEVIQATRWRQENPDLNENQVLSAVESNDWDPSVKALAPYEDLLVQISEDLDWLQSIGDAFLQNEDQVLASVQNLRQKAYDNGTFADNDYYKVSTEGNNIIIESTQREIVYVPYYDTRVAYGNWWWNGYGPTYWHRPRNYTHLSGGFYWNSGYYVRPNIFFGGFHWGSRRLVVNHHYYDNYYGYNGFDRNINISNYRRWSHNPRHRRGVRYPHQIVKSYRAPNNNRSFSRASNPRNLNVNKVQRKLNNIKGTSGNARVSNQRSPVLINKRNKPSSSVAATSSNRVVSNRNPSNRANNPNRLPSAVTKNQRSNNANSRITSTNRKVINKAVTPNRSAGNQRSNNANSSRQRTANQKVYNSNKTYNRSRSTNTYSKSSNSSRTVNKRIYK